MALWMVRAGKTGDREALALDRGIAVLGWDDLPDLSPFTTREEIDALYQRTFPDSGRGKRGNHVGQLFAFVRRIQTGDIIVLPLKRSSALAFGTVRGPYAYRTDLGAPMHVRPVDWVRQDAPRSSVDQDLLYSFGAAMTVCQIERHDAERRVRALLSGSPPPRPASSAEEEANGYDHDVEEFARDQISSYILRKFKGDGMTRLVEAILRAEGYVTLMSPRGADGGVDILAGLGPLGFSQPRLCVQVKSQETPLDVEIVRALQGSLTTFHADQGLLVCWGGFKQSAFAEARTNFFSIRLWDSGALVDALLHNYDRLSAELQAELPLKRTWALVLDDER